MNFLQIAPTLLRVRNPSMCTAAGAAYDRAGIERREGAQIAVALHSGSAP